FSMAVQRSMEELNSRIQAFIKEKCTAIHPVVEWRFRKAVLKSIEQRAEDANDAGAELEPIVFERVYPLYGLADIRGASAQRDLPCPAAPAPPAPPGPWRGPLGARRPAAAGGTRAALPAGQACRQDLDESQLGR